MLYLATSPYEPAVADLLSRHRIGLMCQPANGNGPRPGWIWAADNGAFSEKWDALKWVKWLSGAGHRSGCLFAVVPDVVGDAAATDDRFDRYVSRVRYFGYPVAYVAQDGVDRPPWDRLDCLFVGGSSAFKMSEQAFALVNEARERGKWTHIGRINSWSRFQAWTSADSCDGTFLAFGPKKNVPRLLRWLDRHDSNPQLSFAAPAEQETP